MQIAHRSLRLWVTLRGEEADEQIEHIDAEAVRDNVPACAVMTTRATIARAGTGWSDGRSEIRRGKGLLAVWSAQRYSAGESRPGREGAPLIKYTRKL